MSYLLKIMVSSVGMNNYNILNDMSYIYLIGLTLTYKLRYK